jgi:ketosteroid isomerase-like protein
MSTQSNDTVELKQIQQRLIRAWVSRDRETINSILADDWIVTDPAGRVLTKAEVMTEFDSGERKLESGTIDDVNVRLFYNVAVVTGRTAATGSYQGQSISVKLRFTDVFVKRSGNWQAVASQATLIAQ